MKSVIVGTAGHVDHGKSSLVEALTGTHPDRWEEERRRGITLDLGFAFLDLEGFTVAFVDVPGHERFIRNMLAGAGGFDLVLLVIAADESIKPQTREHFEICKLLGISSGLVALTKSDLVSPEALDLVRLEIEEFLRGSFLDGAPVVPVSATNRSGLGDLRIEIGRLARLAPSRDPFGYFRLPVDRAFAMKGFGTVVTGTLVSGQISPEDEVELFPSRRLVRVRGVQTDGKQVDRAVAGQRTALNLAGVDHDEVRRGMVLSAPGCFEPTMQLDVRITLLASSRPLKHRTRVHFHQGTAETIAEVYLFDAGEIAPGASSYAQLRLSEPVLVLPGDRFILRQFSPLVTIGGGVVLDALARRHKLRDPYGLALLETLERALSKDSTSRSAALASLVTTEPRGASLEYLVARTGWQRDEILSLAAANPEVRLVSSLPPVLVAASVIEDCSNRIVNAVEDFHRGNPLVPAIAKEDLRMQVASAATPEVFHAALKDLIASGKLSVKGDAVALAGRSVRLRPEEALAKQQIEEEFARAGLKAPEVARVLTALAVESRRAENLLQLLLREKKLLRINSELVFHHAALDRLREQLAEYKRSSGPRLSIGDFKELTGVSRKYAIPLLEYLDREHVTRRVEDDRVIL